MADVNLSWTNSTPGAKQRKLARTVIDARAAAALPWSTINTVDVPTNTLKVQNLDPGSWEFRATEVDDGNVASTNQPTASVDIPFDPPSGVTVFTASLA